MSDAQAQAGVFEYVFGGLQTERDELLKFWAVLGFEIDVEGELGGRDARDLYGHGSELQSIRLRHPG